MNPLLDKTNWTAVWSNRLRSCTSATTIAPDKVNAVFADAGGTLGPDEINYAPPPFDVMATDLVPVAAFSNFPIT
jgi:hypothetical protein